MLRRLLSSVLCCVVLGAVQAQASPETDRLLDAVHLSEILDILAQESQANGRDMDEMMLSGRGGVAWDRIIAAIHDPAHWEARVRDKVAEVLPPEQIAPIASYLESPQGQHVTDLEIAARRAMLDDEVEAAGQERLADLRAAQAPILDQVARFIAANDLIDANVVSALNSNLAFAEGMAEGAGKPTRGDALAEVMAQEPDIRVATEDWLMTYLAMAYSSLSEADLEAYIAFSESPAGEAFNAALFLAFDEMFVATSRATGQALGRMMLAEDI